MFRTILPLGLAALALAGCQGGIGGESGGASRDQIRAVGSSTVYPFTTAVAEQFHRRYPDLKAPIVEPTGTGSGLKLFCAGIGARFPDVANASRRIKKSEVKDCASHGVTHIVEIQIGIDGIALAESQAGAAMRLTQEDIYRALAATPYGRTQTARTWRDVNPALPPIAIRVLGPPPTSGTRDAFAELILDKGCDADSAMQSLKARDPDRHRTICSKIREDGAYVETGENDNLVVQKLAANPDDIGVFGYSFLEENRDRLRGIAIHGVEPSYETIASFAYPGARPLYIYVKGAHLDAIPGLRQFVAEYARGWNPDGYLRRRGLISAPEDVRARNLAIATRLTPFDPAQAE